MMPLTPLTAAPADGESVAEEQHASASTSEPGSAADGEQPTAESAATPPDETAGQVETASAATDRVAEKTTPAAAAPNAEGASPANHSCDLPLGEEETPVVEAAATPVEAGRPEAVEVADAIAADETDAGVGENDEPDEEAAVVVQEEEGDARAGECPNGIHDLTAWYWHVLLKV